MRQHHTFAVVLALLATSTAAYAGDNVECYTAPARWNAPDGTLVLSKSSGDSPISAVITAIGEYYTHTVTSHGLDWASHDTMRIPRTYGSSDGQATCGAPIHPGDLANGWPGGRNDNPGGMWAFYFNNGGFMNGQTALIYSTALGSTYAYNNDSSASAQTYGTDATVASCLVGWEGTDLSGASGCGSNSPGPGCSGPVPYGYSVYAYSQYQTSPSGHGTMCSGLISREYYYGRNGAGNYCDPNGIATYTYANAKVVNGANSLYNQIEGGSQGFFGTLGACIACFDCNLLDEAADQTVNCFAYNQGTWCSKADHDWAGNSVSGNTANTISPDRLYGISGHYASTGNNSPWRPAPGYSVQFNQGGTAYGCWY